MPGLVPGIHVFLFRPAKTWMAGASPAMTRELQGLQSRHAGIVMRRRNFLALGIAALAAPYGALAQAKYPDRPIRLVIPFPPGGGYDAVGRPWAEKIKSLLGTVVVENQGGGGSSLGAAAVARARADGYTI